jgi:hypothetical protein
MGQITDALRRHLRDIAHSDARSLRAIGEVIQSESPPASQSPRTDDEEDRTNREKLLQLPRAKLYSLCREKGLQGLSKAKKAELIEALLSDAASPTPPPLSVAERLDRLEKGLLLIAREVGIPAEHLEQLFHS